LCSISGAHAQTYPTKPVRFVCPFPPGGGSEPRGAHGCREAHRGAGTACPRGQSRGAAGNIGTEIVAKAPPTATRSSWVAPVRSRSIPGSIQKLPFDPARDFTPVSLATIMPFLLAVAPGSAGQVGQGADRSRQGPPDQLNYGSPGNGSTTHLANELLKSMTGMRITHVPYKGVAPAATDLISGQIQMMSGDLSTLLPNNARVACAEIAVTGANDRLAAGHADHRRIGRAGIRSKRMVRGYCCPPERHRRSWTG